MRRSYDDYAEIAHSVVRATGLVLTAGDVHRLVDLGRGTGDPSADRMIEREAAEHAIGSA